MASFPLVEQLEKIMVGGDTIYPEEEVLDAFIAVLERRLVEFEMREDDEDYILKERIEQLKELRDGWEGQNGQLMDDLFGEDN